MRADTFFSITEKEEVEKAVKDVEKRTTGEIAVMVVDRSSHYREADALGGTFLASLISFVVTGLYFHFSLWAYIPLSFLLFFFCRELFKRIPVLKVSLVGRRRREAAVRDRALRAFYEKGLYKTRHNTGVLFFISILERKVWVLADKGIHGRIHQTLWDGLARKVSAGVKEGRACSALLEAIAEAGDVLAEHYPAGSGDTDELPDAVICEPIPVCDPD